MYVRIKVCSGDGSDSYSLKLSTSKMIKGMEERNPSVGGNRSNIVGSAVEYAIGKSIVSLYGSHFSKRNPSSSVISFQYIALIQLLNGFRGFILSGVL